MSNIGRYQDMTTLAKGVGGPLNLGAIILVSGYCILRPLEAAVIWGFRKVRRRNTENSETSMEYDVVREGTDSQGLTFTVGEKIRVMASADDAVLIEKVGDDNNPYIVSKAFLESITEFEDYTVLATADGFHIVLRGCLVPQRYLKSE